MNIEDFEKEVFGIFKRNISEKERERIRWFIVKIKGEYAEKTVSVTSCVLDSRFQMHTMAIMISKDYEQAFQGVLKKIKEKFGDTDEK